MAPRRMLSRHFGSCVPQIIHNDLRLTTDDGVSLRYTDTGGDGNPLVLLHGWTANGRWFDKNVESLAENGGLRVITMDYRGMGDSEHCGHGARVARISKDVKNLVDYLDLEDAVFCGTSMGLCAAAFVDQTAAQYIKPGWGLGSLGGCTREMVADLQAQLKYDPDGCGRAVAAGGFGLEPPSEEEYTWFLNQFKKCDLEFCGRLMEDHANLDLRDLVPKMDLPILNMIGGSTKCHNIQGMEYIGENAPNAKNIYYDNYGHWLYWEDAERFNKDILEFVLKVNEDSKYSMKDF